MQGNSRMCPCSYNGQKKGCVLPCLQRFECWMSNLHAKMGRYCMVVMLV